MAKRYDEKTLDRGPRESSHYGAPARPAAWGEEAQGSGSRPGRKAGARGADFALTMWKERFRLANDAYTAEQGRMKRREALLNGSHEIVTPDGKRAKKQASHVRNVCFELVETQVDSNIPQPKVTAVRQEDEEQAKLIEDLLRNLLDRLPMERINDEAERISPTQGGYGLLVDWDSSAAGRGWMGALKVTLLHPRKIIPQDGVYQVADMDYLFVEDAQTKRQIRERFGVDVSAENEEEPEARALNAPVSAADELVTLRTAYYKNRRGGIGRFRWVNDVVLEDLEDYQARRVQVCRGCGVPGDGVRCRFCGSTRFREELQEDETLTDDLETASGLAIPAESPARDEYGQVVMRDVEAPSLMEPLMGGTALMPGMEPPGVAGVYSVRQEAVMEATRIPFYKPCVFPVVLRKNVSASGRFLGGSDIDAIEDQQNTLNKIGTKVNEKVLGGGSFVTMPKGMGRFQTDQDNRVLEVENPAALNCIRSYNTQVDISQDMARGQEVYEEARQTIGITDSLQGRRDPTATSKVAKEFAASQAAGRLESKRVMKNALFQDLFEVLFKFMLAYADEPRPVISYNERGEKVYKVFDRHDFLYQDEAGAWKYNTDFLFSCDSSAPLAANREAMWQECRMNFESGALGDPTALTTLVRFWAQMEVLHYPMAESIHKELQEELEQQREAQRTMDAMGGAAGGVPGMGAVSAPAEDMGGGDFPSDGTIQEAMML
ncbi:hypothetical protein [uncultured Dysosmobacter sp.]|uniref:hypothetical protein n=1 Tax=uncultured Dysosmobacter sp. TaxID=2591384 RepID=UPI0026148D7A|nr:hypothetical protein [uncultured Dysosmobacter sp.]